MRDPIINATFNLTHNCNLTCSYCFTHGKGKQVMDFSMAKKCINFLLDNVKNTDVVSMKGRSRQIEITFWGGEPLLEWKTIDRIIRYSKKRNDGVPILFGGTTNGTLLTPDKVDYCFDNNIHFLVSFDGTPESHNTYRVFRNGGGSHSVIARNIEYILKRFPGQKVRMSPFAEGIHRLYEDVKYIFSLGIKSAMFSPVYESGWNEERWITFSEQMNKISELLIEKKNKGEPVEIEHYRDYAKGGDSRWPCGAGRFYVGFDIDGAIYPCHRFNKFNDSRHWSQKEVCIGHVDYGITNPIFRDSFIRFDPIGCSECEMEKVTPCHGGCYAVNYDLMKSIRTPPKNLCNYIKVQHKASMIYKEGFGSKGFPVTEKIYQKIPSPQDFIKVTTQMEEKVKLFEKMLKL